LSESFFVSGNLSLYSRAAYLSSVIVKTRKKYLYCPQYLGALALTVLC